MLEGLKTYLIVAVAILSAILGYFNDQLTLLQAGQAIGLALGIAGNRSILQVGQMFRTGFGTLAVAEANRRKWITYVGTALTILTAAIAGVSGEQDSVVTIAAILGALGINFLGVGAKKTVTGQA